MGINEVVQRSGGVPLPQLQVPTDGKLDPIRRIRAEVDLPALRALIRLRSINGNPTYTRQMKLRPAVITLDFACRPILGDREADLEPGRNPLGPR